MSVYKSSKDSAYSTIEIVYGKDKVRVNMFRELKIEEETIEDSLKRQPVTYGFICTAYQGAVQEVKLFKLELDGFYSELYNKYKDKVISGKYLTKEALENKIKSDPKYRLMCKKLIRLETSKGILEDFKRALEQKKDIMQTLSANRRKEL